MASCYAMSTLSSIGVAVVTSIATTTVIDIAIKPRIEARNRLMQAARDGRTEFSKHVLTILAACGRLQIGRPNSDHPARQKLLEERRRWVAQIDTATRELADSVERYALTYVSFQGIAQKVVMFAMLNRLIWVSARPVDERIRMVRELTEAVQDVYFARRIWRPVRFWRARMNLERLIRSYQDDQPGSP